MPICRSTPLLLLALCLLVRGYPLPTWQSPEVTPWPKPMRFTNGSTTAAIQLLPPLQLITASGSLLLQRAFVRLQNNVEAHLPHSPLGMDDVAPSEQLSHVYVLVSTDDETLDDKTNETYALSITTFEIRIQAATVYGALHAFESLFHLAEVQASGRRVVRGVPWTIEDAPRFAHRGVLVDSSRHYQPIAVIQTMIDAMAMSKLNVLHWHIVDDVSFPFNSTTTQLGKGAWSYRETYSPDDLKAIVAYARDRGVRVVPEVDTPGHIYSWGFGHPNVVTACPQTLARLGIYNAVLDPSEEETFTVISALLTELNAIFPDPFFHLGGDEVYFTCWRESQKVTDFMQKMGFGQNYSLLQQYYQNRLLNISATALKGKTLVIYQDTSDNGVVLPKTIVYDAWKAGPSPNVLEEMVSLIKQGYRTILANGPNGEWYLNDGFGNGNVVALWPAIYSMEPLNVTEKLTPDQQALILGGEVSLWAEEINENSLLSKAFPRASAFAEKMWSPAAVTVDVAEAAPRYARMYCRLLFRGIPGDPISPGSCYHR